MTLTERIGMALPIVQAPMAGVATPALAAAVSEAGGLGSLGLGATDVGRARAMIAETRARTDRAFNVNLFVHRAPVRDAAREAAWIDRLAPLFREQGAEPPTTLEAPYRSFAEDPDMLAMLVETRPAVVSFHFGLPGADAIAALKDAGAVLLATATCPEEARAIEAAGLDGVIAQGIEAGGHRGMFDPGAPDAELGTMALTRLLVREGGLPVIAAGGIMDGAGVAAAMALGAAAAQLGTAFIACPESAADAAYRAALVGEGGRRTVLTPLISGRPARVLGGRFAAIDPGVAVPDYPVAYHAGKALNAAAVARGERGYGAWWAGQGAPMARAMPAAALMRVLAEEMGLP